jgi:hypothetical protein
MRLDGKGAEGLALKELCIRSMDLVAERQIDECICSPARLAVPQPVRFSLLRMALWRTHGRESWVVLRCGIGGIDTSKDRNIDLDLDDIISHANIIDVGLPDD